MKKCANTNENNMKAAGGDGNQTREEDIFDHMGGPRPTEGERKHEEMKTKREEWNHLNGI